MTGDNKEIKKLNRYKRLVLYKKRPLNRADIELAMKYTKSNRAAARYLGVNYLTYRAAAKKYLADDGRTLFEVHFNQAGIGIRKYGIPKKNIIPLDDIFANKWPDISPVRLKNRLVGENLLPEMCANCGYAERRMFDNRVPLILNFLDNNIHNFEFKNLELLCYNCYYHLVGNPLNPYKVYMFPRLNRFEELTKDERDVIQ